MTVKFATHLAHLQEHGTLISRHVGVKPLANRIRQLIKKLGLLYQDVGLVRVQLHGKDF